MAASPDDVADDADRTIDDARRTSQDARSAVTEIARQVERLAQEQLDRFRSQSREAADAAGEQLESARLYAIERVQERPFTTTLAALGAGFLIGLLFAGKRR